MNREDTIEKIADLEEILMEIKDLLRQARKLLQGTPAAENAEDTWMRTIDKALAF